MQKRFLGALVAFFLSLSTVMAVADGTVSEPIYHIQQIDEDAPVEQLQGPGIIVHKANDPEQDGSGLPSVQKREETFYQAGLRPDIDQWDQLQRDMLYIRARANSPDNLAKRYPQLSKDKLTSLCNLVTTKNGSHAAKETQ